MIGGELTVTGDGFVILVIVSALFGLWVGWMAGKAEGRDQERERLLPIHREMRADFDREQDQRRSADRLVRMSTKVIGMQLQTIRELEAQIAAFPIPSQGTS